MQPKQTETKQNTPETLSARKPTASTEPVPVWLIVVLYLLLYWGMLYFDRHSDWFDPRVYAPYRTLEEVVQMHSKGLTGPVEVRGRIYDTGAMGAIGDQMPGDENQKTENIAAIISYVRKNFGEGATPVRPDEVGAIRAQIADRKASYTPDELKSIPVDK